MSKKSITSIEGLLENETFLNYYFQKNEGDIFEWEDWAENQPERIALVGQTFQLLDKLSLKWSPDQIKAKYLPIKNMAVASKEEYSAHFSLFSTKNWQKVALAASILIFVGIGLFIQNNQKSVYQKNIAESSLALVQKKNDTQKPLLLNLPDGSSVLMQPNSKISFPKAFTNQKREVYFEGEAFFEVKKDAEMPFYVYANELVTKVLGTSFFVKAHVGESNIKVIVKTGKVSVFRKNKKTKTVESKILEGVVITPNQQIIYNVADDKFKKSIIEKPEILPEIQNFNFDFVNTPATDVLAAIENVYGIKIIYNTDTWKNCKVYASLSDEPLYGKLDLLCKAIEANYQLIDGQIIINGTGCK